MYVGVTQYVRAKNESMLLAAFCNGDLLDIYALEMSLTDLIRLREGFVFVFYRRLGVEQGTSLVGVRLTPRCSVTLDPGGGFGARGVSSYLC